MNEAVKIAIGLGAALAAGWISHGPMGRGDAFVDRLEVQANQLLAAAEMPLVKARMERDPLERVAILSGPANDFQREGQGLFPGINDRIREIPGMKGIEWADGQEMK